MMDYFCFISESKSDSRFFLRFLTASRDFILDSMANAYLFQFLYLFFFFGAMLGAFFFELDQFHFVGAFRLLK